VDSTDILAATAGAFLLTGFVKGVIGMGLPTVSIGLLGLLVTPIKAAAILGGAVTDHQYLAGCRRRREYSNLCSECGHCSPAFAWALYSACHCCRMTTGGQQSGSASRSSLCGAGAGKEPILRAPPCGDLAGTVNGRGDRRHHGCDWNPRHAGDALFAGARIRARQDGAGARCFVHNIHDNIRPHAHACRGGVAVADPAVTGRTRCCTFRDGAPTIGARPD
jgi:hypothetical protein